MISYTNPYKKGGEYVCPYKRDGEDSFPQKNMKPNTNPNRWWESLKVIRDPVPHIPESDISAVMPENIKPAWEEWIKGQTGLMCDDGGFGVYEWDWARFVGKLESNSPLVDTATEWD